MDANWTDYLRDVAGTLRSGSPDLALVASKSAQASEHMKKLSDAFPAGDGP